MPLAKTSTGQSREKAAKEKKANSAEQVSLLHERKLEPALADGDDSLDNSAATQTGSSALDDSVSADETADHTGSDDAVDIGNKLSSHMDFEPVSPRLVTRPVRSGQQLYARATDLIIMAHVGPGAEVVADNNIHVYGPLRGRALCGVTGNTESRIFCQSLEAELVSVAGNYKLLEEIPEDLRGKPAQIWYHEGRLNIDPL